jgi:hypothetical protein
VFADRDALVEKIITDPSDPSYPLSSIQAWRADFGERLREAQRAGLQLSRPGDGLPQDEVIPVGRITGRGQRLYNAKRRQEGRKADQQGLSLEISAEPPAGETS